MNEMHCYVSQRKMKRTINSNAYAVIVIALRGMPEIVFFLFN